MIEALEKRAAKGAALLDEKRPGWADEVDLERLDMSNCVTCVLGQLFGGYLDGVEATLGRLNGGARCGFDLYDGLEEYVTLNKLWTETILARRTAKGA